MFIPHMFPTIFPNLLMLSFSCMYICMRGKERPNGTDFVAV